MRASLLRRTPLGPGPFSPRRCHPGGSGATEKQHSESAKCRSLHRSDPFPGSEHRKEEYDASSGLHRDVPTQGESLYLRLFTSPFR